MASSVRGWPQRYAYASEPWALAYYYFMISIDIIIPQVFAQKNQEVQELIKIQVSAMKSADHPNILKVYDVFDTEPDGTLYAVSWFDVTCDL
jgi:serine/threonine protein kinase